MSATLTDESLPDITPGTRIVVRKEFEAGPYIVRGKLIGFELHIDGPAVCVLPDDGLRRVVPLPAKVTVDG